MGVGCQLNTFMLQFKTLPFECPTCQDGDIRKEKSIGKRKVSNVCDFVIIKSDEYDLPIKRKKRSLLD